MVQQNKKVKNNSWFILDSNGLAVQLLEASLIRMSLLALLHGLIMPEDSSSSDEENHESGHNSEGKIVGVTHYIIPC